jgi:16S rRNA (adenine1518-N6/adenine1519-N6)-dimethyltransferase
MVRPKKFLGQHFLTDQNIARKIADAFIPEQDTTVIEIGPGTGALTRFLVERHLNPVLIEIDAESVEYLKSHYTEKQITLIQGDFLEQGLSGIAGNRFAVIGNFPYNISSQIFFKVLENRSSINLVVGMIQKEVAQRIASGPGNRTYGILSVLIQAFFDVKILFHVPPGVFNPPPKVMSSVIRLIRNQTKQLGCDEIRFFTVVKRAFQNRRKTLRNALKDLNLPAHVYALEIMAKRAEQLGVQDYVRLVNTINDSEGVSGV